MYGFATTNIIWRAVDNSREIAGVGHGIEFYHNDAAEQDDAIVAGEMNGKRRGHRRPPVARCSGRQQ
jgi:hypothetical protein